MTFLIYTNVNLMDVTFRSLFLSRNIKTYKKKHYYSFHSNSFRTLMIYVFFLMLKTVKLSNIIQAIFDILH